MIQVVFDRNYYNYQGMYEENVGLRIGTEVRWYAHIDHTGREDSEQLATYNAMVAKLHKIVNAYIEAGRREWLEKNNLEHRGRTDGKSHQEP